MEEDSAVQAESNAEESTYKGEADPWQDTDPWARWSWDHSWCGGDQGHSTWDWNVRRPSLNAARVEETTMAIDGQWRGSASGASYSRRSDGEDRRGEGKPTEKMTVPTFDGEAADGELGVSARSYIRKIKVWVRCTKMPPVEQALALYTNLHGKAWLIAEELDMDMLAGTNGVEYYMDWVRVRFMEVEVTKVSNVMTALFRKCRRKPEQSVREFNLEFERLLLHLLELGCELPDLVKGWLYLDRLRLPEHEELSILSSQQAAMIHDRGNTRKWNDTGRLGSKWASRGGSRTVHMAVNDNSEDDEEAQAGVGAVGCGAGGRGRGRAVPRRFHGVPGREVEVSRGDARPWNGQGRAAQEERGTAQGREGEKLLWSMQEKGALAQRPRVSSTWWERSSVGDCGYRADARRTPLQLGAHVLHGGKAGGAWDWRRGGHDRHHGYGMLEDGGGTLLV